LANCITFSRTIGYLGGTIPKILPAVFTDDRESIYACFAKEKAPAGCRADGLDQVFPGPITGPCLAPRWLEAIESSAFRARPGAGHVTLASSLSCLLVEGVEAVFAGHDVCCVG